jgi:hypothetical protein
MRRDGTDPRRPGRAQHAGLRALACLLLVAQGCASPAPPERAPYVFGWPFVDTNTLEPRGGTTRGSEVSLALAPSAEWERLQTSGLAPRERDRAAILALAGEYRTSFDFLELLLYEPGATPARPYRSWGTERIDVLEERPDFVSLQHTLVMFVADEGGARLGPFVQKHWRQDWSYEPDRQLAYLGEGRFGLREVPPERRQGSWSQTVYQVDDSPRFATSGRWSHDSQRSVWEGASAWRPLPRRESSVRSDYQVLAGNHRLTVLPTGWVHEQQNEKLVVSRGVATASRGRELGVNRYERIQGFDFAAADRYWQATATFWSSVRKAWADRLDAGGDIEVSKTCGDAFGFQLAFAYAGRLERGEVSGAESDARAEAERIVSCLVDGERP